MSAGRWMLLSTFTCALVLILLFRITPHNVIELFRMSGNTLIKCSKVTAYHDSPDEHEPHTDCIVSVPSQFNSFLALRWSSQSQRFAGTRQGRSLKRRG